MITQAKVWDVKTPLDNQEINYAYMEFIRVANQQAAEKQIKVVQVIPVTDQSEEIEAEIYLGSEDGKLVEVSASFDY